MVEGGGFEPPKLSWQIYNLLPLATREPLHSSGAYIIYAPVRCKAFFLFFIKKLRKFGLHTLFC